MNKAAAPIYFGKLPSRGDFVRGVADSVLVAQLDTWATQALEQLAEDAHWKQVYDAARPLDFAFVSRQHRHALAGHLIPSTDASGRRFPFMTATTFEVEAAFNFPGHSPLLLAPWWQRLAQVARSAHEGNLAVLQAALDPVPAAALRAPYGDFLELETVGGLQQMLAAVHASVDVRATILAVGLLLHQLPGGRHQSLGKGIRLPLPADALRRVQVATLWLDLVAELLADAPFELALFLVPEPSGGANLSIGFAAADPACLQAVLDERVGLFVPLAAPGWVQDDLQRQRPAVRTLAAYLDQPGMSLGRVVASFRSAFSRE